jgi:import inner membrane translocase subunit TIM44
VTTTTSASILSGRWYSSERNQSEENEEEGRERDDDIHRRNHHQSRKEEEEETTREEEKDDDDDTSKKAREVLSAFRKRRDALRTDPRVKEAISEAKKFKEEMKKEVGMERMFGGRGTRAAAEENGSNEDASSTTASEKNNEGEAAKSSSSSSFLSSSSSFVGRYFNVALDAVREEVRLLNMDESEQFKEKRRKQREKEMRDYAAAASRDGDAPASTAVQIVKPKDPTRFERMFEDVKQKLGFSEENLDKLQQSEAVKRLKNVQEDLRERWETSDSPMVHRIQDASESFFGETDQAEAMKLIRQMDVGFNTSDFLSEVKSTVPDVIKSYLLGDVEALKKMENISPEIIERMDGQINAWKSLGHVVDARLLHVSELELVEIRVLDNSPTVVLQFACQQVNCVRDAKTKEIIEGANDDIQSVHYLWAMQLSDAEFQTEDGRTFSKPTWQLREMVLRGMMSIT